MDQRTSKVNSSAVSMKQALVTAMHKSGVFAPFRVVNRGKTPILMYHRFSESEGGVSTSARCFSEQVDYLSDHYELVPLSALAGYLTSGKRVPRGLAVITIDDGYRDCYDIAFPILRQRNIPATLFVVTGFVDQVTWLWTDKVRYLTERTTGSLLEARIGDQQLRIKLNGTASRLKVAAQVNSGLKVIDDEAKDAAVLEMAASLGVSLPDAPPSEFFPVTWEQAREMDSNGIEIGSHTVTHPILTQTSTQRLRYELSESRSRLESALGHKVDLLGYPNGDHDRSVREEASRAGYNCAVAAEYGLNNGDSNPLALKRLHSEPDLARFVKNTSGFDAIRNMLGHLRLGGTARAIELGD
jgi:peptidoglycan/xylan/chitin deacetylase (PgdA/CDA1 family)